MKSKPKIEYITEFRFCHKNHFLILKGISILLVVLAHFCEQYLGISYLMPLQGVAAAVFLLCSGYGVSESFNNKKGLTHYWENKAIKIWLPSVVATVIFSVINERNAIAWVGNNPLALHGWFLYLLFGEYLAFWLAFYFLESKTARLAALFTASALGFAFVGIPTVAAQMFCFPLGVLASQLGFKHSVRQLKTGGKALLCAILALVAVATYFLQNILSQKLLMSACGAVGCLSAAALLCVGVYFIQKIGIFGIFAPIGTISYAVYLLHEQVLTLLEGRLEWRIAVAVFVGLFVISTVYTWLCNLLGLHNKKLRRSKSTPLKGSM